MKVPSSKVAVVITTYGTKDWEIRGDEAYKKVYDTQVSTPFLVHFHDHYGSLPEARNSATKDITTEWLVFLDADDELHPDFVQTLEAYDGNEDILKTSVRGFRDNDGQREWIESLPVFRWQKYPLVKQNYLTIGSPIRTEMFRKVGGFDELPVLEDWDLWLRCEKAGATFGTLAEAVYQINDDHSRNRHPDIDAVARQIRAKYQ